MAFHDMSLIPIHWSDVDGTVINLEKLRLLCSSEKALKREGYIMAQLDSNAILSKLKCRNCGKKMRLPELVKTNAPLRDPADNDPNEMTLNSGRPKNVRKGDLCEFHPGKVAHLHFTCCQSHVSVQKGCQINLTHSAPDNHMEVLRTNWTYHITPQPTPVVPSWAPDTSQGRQRRGRVTNITAPFPRSAIALDCEFGVSINNEPELIRISAIDFFTMEVLIDSLVKPSVIIKNYQTRYSGVTSLDIRKAVQNQSCIFGRDAAREKLLKFIDADTIIIVHGGSTDMTSLRMIHPNIIDTYILETYFEPTLGGRSLRNLCEKKLSIQIQTGKGHDSLEDALACRELAIWMMKLIPNF